MSSVFASHNQVEFLLARDVQPKLFGVLMAALAIVSTLIQWFYNLYLHPKRKIPGPRLAAMTSLYEFWFDIVRDGKYPEEIKRMHEVYGPVVRISPHEVHVQKSKHRGIIRTPGSPRVRKVPATVTFALPTSVTTPVNHGHHRARRLNSLLLQAVQNQRRAYAHK
nr:cytochrome P450 [Trichoderma calamagrostidis]